MRRGRRIIGPSWIDADDIQDPRCRDIEEQVEMRKSQKRLCDCSLPEGFRLVRPDPRQLRMNNQLRWAFVVAWHDRLGVARYFYAAAYDHRIPDETQLGWALDDFSRELREAGVTVEPVRKRVA